MYETVAQITHTYHAHILLSIHGYVRIMICLCDIVTADGN
jgi:hypothetical protein